MIKSQVTLKQLEAFIFVLDTGTFRKAAAALGTTQPNISARIAALEKTLGVELLRRDTGSVRLTEKGEQLAPAARQVLWSTEQFLETAQRRDLIDQRLRLGVTELIACTWLHQFLRRFKALYPAIIVELDVDISREIEKDLEAGHLDLALQTGPFKIQSSGSLPLGRYRYVWVATPDIATQLGPKPDMAALFSHGVMTHARHTIAAGELATFVSANNLPRDRIVHSSSLASCLPMAVDGMGVALLPRQLVRDALERGQLVQVDAGWEPSPLDFHARYDARRAPRFVVQAAELAISIAQSDRQ